MDISVKILLIIGQTLSFAELRSSAVDTLAFVGDTVTMSCASGTKGCSSVTWKRRAGSSSSHAFENIIYNNNRLLDNVDRTRYSVDSSNASGCHMTIRSIQLRDSGRYDCEAILDANTKSKETSLIILESRPKCVVHLPPASNESAVEGDQVTFTCEWTYEGGEGNMTWKGVEKGRSKTERINNTTRRLSYSVVAGTSGISSLTCEVRFTSQNKATVVNSLMISCLTPEIEVLFSVRNVRLSPLSSAFSPGSVVTCQADGNPPPSIRWQSLNTQNVSAWRDVPEANGSRLVVGSDASVRYRCVASNSVRNSSHSEISCQIAVGESETDGYSTRVAIAIGFATGFLVAVVLMSVVWLLHKRFGHRSGESKELKSKE